MNILMLRSDVALAGPGIAALRLAKALMEQGHVVRMTTSGGDMVSRFEQEGVPVDILPDLSIDRRSIPGTLRCMLGIRQLVREHSIDVMHSFNAHAALTAEFARRTTAARLVHTVLGTGKERMNKLHRAKINAVSADTRERLLTAGIDARRITVVPPLSVGKDYLIAGDRQEEVIRHRVARKDCRFVSVAMFTGAKGQELLIERFALFAQRTGLSFELILVGDGPSRAQCERLSAELGIAGKVIFAGEQKDVRPFLDQADCFVHHSVTETFGMVMVEAGARRLPTVVADVGGISDIIVDGETGFLVDFDDETGFVDALERIAVSPGVRHEMGRAAFSRVASELVKDVVLPRYIDLYERD